MRIGGVESKIKKRRGRPPEGRVPFLCHVLPETRDKIDAIVLKSGTSRGKVIEQFYRKLFKTKANS